MRGRLAYAIGLVTALAMLAGPAASASAALSGVDLSTYVRVSRNDLPEPTRTTPPANSLLAQEASAVTYDWDTDTLFVVGDGGTSVVQVSKTGQLINSMTLAQGSSPQGTEFYDTEGITYVGSGKFVLVEERYRQVNLFTYVAGATLGRADVKTVKLGTTIGNIGIEGITNDPMTNGFIAVKEKEPEGIFQTGIDFTAGTATNGSPTTDNSTNLFDPALADTLDFSDVFALSNLSTLTGPDTSHLLVISQESGKVINISRTGVVSSTLTISSDPGNPLSVPDQGDEGVTMDNDGKLYVVNENGGGDVDHPQLWVYAPSTAANQAPTAVTLNNQVTSMAENTSTATRIKVADVAVADDGLGTNNLTVTGPDASSFEVDSTGLYIKAGTALDFETKPSYNVSVAVDDPTVGSTPDATSAQYTLTVTDVSDTPALIISEVSPFSSGNTTYKADWFELTNIGTGAATVTGWKMDDGSNAFSTAVPMIGVTTIAPGASAIFVEGTAATATAFSTAWFGGTPPAGVAVGSYTGSGVGLSTSGDGVSVFDSSGTRVTAVSFGTVNGPATLDNSAGLGNNTASPPTISTVSVVGVHGAYVAGGETGSPGTTVNLPPTATTDPASAITDTGAGLAGNVNPSHLATNYTFEYGTTLSFGAITPVLSAGSGGAAVPETASLSGLTANTTYYYRLVATNSAGTSVGVVHSFRTTGVAQLPNAVTGAASGVTNSSATLAGQVNPNGQQTAYTFEYGTSTAFGSITPVVALDNADVLEAVTAHPTGLSPDTTYYYRLVATNATGTSSGSVGVFSTGPGGPPVVSTGAASAITSTGATLAATVDAHGIATAYTFEYGTTNAFGSISAVDSAGSTNGANPYSLPITGLTPNTTYRYRIVATNANGTTAGSVGSFTTAPGT
jgi:uncharacterized protein YjiK